MNDNSKKKNFFIFLIFLILIYLIYYLSIIFHSKLYDYHQFLLLGINVLLLLPNGLFYFHYKSLFFKFSIYILIMALIVFSINFFVSFLILDIFFYSLSGIAFILVLLGTYCITVNKRDKYNYEIYSGKNESFFIEYKKRYNQIIVEFSPTFLKKYKGIKSKTLITYPETYQTYIHKEDYDKIKQLETKYRIKFPGMNKYIYVLIKSADFENRRICLGFDINESVEEHDKIIEAKRACSTLELEKRKIIESSNDFVAKFKIDGTIVYASSNYAKLYHLDENNIVGKNIFVLNKKRGLDTEWFTDTLKNHSFRGQDYEVFNDKKIWISWHNDVLLDDKGNVEFVITVGRDITKLVELNNYLEYRNRYDYLTGLYNRQGLYKTVETITDVKNAICFFIEIEHFSSINYYYGNKMGDLILKKIAEELKACDNKNNNNIIARYSGAQFVLMCFDFSENEKLIMLKKMKALLNRTYKINDSYIRLHKRIGYAFYPYDSEDLVNLISLSNLAKNEISDQNLVKLLNYQTFMSVKLYRNINMSVRLIDALKNNIIDVYFQKIINVQDNKIYFLEALARWHDKDKGFISPPVFFEIAKLTNTIDQLDIYIFNKAIKHYAKLRLKEEYKESILTLNITPQTLMQTNIPDKIEEIIKEYNVKPHQVCIEVSENTFVNNINVSKENIKNFKDKGFLIALDDFGREYSSLSILDNIDFDLIKIDGVFVRNITKPQNQAIVQMVMKISEISNKQIIAECVENIEESNILISMNCYLQQGYYFHKPELL